MTVSDARMSPLNRHRHLLDALIQHATERPDIAAISDRHGTTWTWNQLATAVEFQTELNASVSRIAHEVRNEIADVVMALACLASGTMEIAIDARLSHAVRTRMLDIAGVELTENSIAEVAGDQSLVRLRQVSREVDVHQPTLVLWTSGTTLTPRGVMLSAHSLVTNAAAKLKAVPEDNQSRRLTVLPISHAYARTCDMGTWLLSGCHWTIDLGASALDCIDPARPPTHINCVPSIASTIEMRLDEQDPRLANLRILGCGGAAMSDVQFDRFRERGIEVIQGYGCTESSPVICSASPGQTRAGWVGRLVDGWEASIRDGRLYVRGDGTMIGYLNDPNATRAKIDDDGWLDTGDLVERNSDGMFRILGRADDVIVLDNGYKIHPQSIESRFNQLEGIEHAVVLNINGKVLVAIQGEFNEEARAILIDQLPPNTRFEIVKIDPLLSVERNELTSKGTPRRSEIRKRFT